MQPVFKLELHKRDEELLKQIENYFGGALRRKYSYNEGRQSITFRVHCLEQISNAIIPHFDKYPLDDPEASRLPPPK